MHWNEIEEGELLLYASKALPWPRRARIFFRSRFDARLFRRLESLDAEEKEFRHEVEPGLARRLAARLPGTAALGFRGTAGSGLSLRALRSWRSFPVRPKAIFAGIALSSLLAASVLLFQAAVPAPGRGYLSYRAEGCESPRPLIILGY